MYFYIINYNTKVYIEKYFHDPGRKNYTVQNYIEGRIHLLPIQPLFFMYFYRSLHK